MRKTTILDTGSYTGISPLGCAPGLVGAYWPQFLLIAGGVVGMGDWNIEVP